MIETTNSEVYHKSELEWNSEYVTCGKILDTKGHPLKVFRNGE